MHWLVASVIVKMPMAALYLCYRHRYYRRLLRRSSLSLSLAYHVGQGRCHRASNRNNDDAPAHLLLVLGDTGTGTRNQSRHEQEEQETADRPTTRTRPTKT